MPSTAELAIGIAQTFERLANGLWLSRQIDDEAAATYDSGLPRQDCRRHEMSRDAAHLFAEARHLAFAHGQRGFGRDIVAVPGLGATGRDDEMTTGIGKFDERLFDLRSFVGDEALLGAPR